ncbi:MAG: two component regulator propeller/histidine kinase domain protein [Chthoniobacteraceae bacterium]|nr:two component regulator propeller/histidine kinase domain protein [Chthoniobacteraceae bacterium]
MLFLPPFRAVIGCLLSMAAVAQELSPTREPVHPRRNVEEFTPVEAKWVRFTILKTNGLEPCLDELEIYGPDAPSKNLALAETGTRVRASGTLPEYRIHALPHVNDGLYGNGHSWISDTPRTGWVEFELPAVTRISRVVWSRDREGKFIDRLATEYRIEAARESSGLPEDWHPLASSADRAPLAGIADANPVSRGLLGRFSPSATELPGRSRSAGREYVLATWQTAEGLPANTVTALAQTRDGWLWIGTTNGLARFDGVRFTAFGESHGLPALSISCLLEENDGTFWVGTAGGGLARWENGHFSTVTLGENLADNTVLTMTQGLDGALWIGTVSGLFEYRDRHLIRHVEATVSRLVATPSGIWFIFGGQLGRWNNGSLMQPDPALEPSRFSSLGALAGGPGGSLWFGGANGYAGRLADGAVTTFGEGSASLASSLWEILPARTGDVWLGTSASGLARLRDGKLLALTTEDGLPSNSVRAVCEDREGNLWVGTAGGGLTRLRPRQVTALTTGDGLSHNVIMALAEDAHGTIWIGTNGGGLNRWQGGRLEPHAPTYLLENEVISSLAATCDGALWLGTWGSGLFRVASGKVVRFQSSDGLPGRDVSALCEDPADGLWVGTLDGGPAYFSNDEITYPAGIAPLAGQPITAIVTDHAGRVWFGTAGQGVACLENGRLMRWKRADGLASDFVRTLREDSTGTLWAGTSGGLTRWVQGKPESFTVRHGLPDAVVSQIMDDGHGHLWVGTNRGILRIPLHSFDNAGQPLEVLTLGARDGLPSLECTGGFHPSGLRTRDGRLCFGTVGGLALLDPVLFNAASTPPPVLIEEIGIGSAAPSLVGPAPVIVPANTGRVDFRFTALSFTAPERTRFRYMLHGLEPAWIDAGSQRTASYTHLPPGHYHFRVLASLDGGTWSDAGAVVALQVLAPWWQKPWPEAIGALAGVIGVAGVARFLTRRRLQRRLLLVEQQFALERERSRIARDIHDDLGANLTQISMLSALGCEQRDKPALVEEHFNAIAATAGDLVQAMDAIVWAVNPRHNTLESLARYITRFAEDFFTHTPVRLRLDVPMQLPEAALRSEVRHNLFLAAKEALNNALRHAAPTEVRLRLAVEGGQLILHVEDNGRGFLPGTEDSDGNGLGNLRRRLAECAGTCEIVSAPGQGTRILFSIPL